MVNDESKAGSAPESAAEPLEEFGDESRPSIVQEFYWFLRENKKWWLIPLIVMFVVLGLLLLASETPLAPFIYTMM